MIIEKENWNCIGTIAIEIKKECFILKHGYYIVWCGIPLFVL